MKILITFTVLVMAVFTAVGENTASPDSIQNIRRMADSGDARAQCIVGNWYYTGVNGPQDFAKAFEYYSSAASADNVTAIGNLGMCYQFGHGVKPDSVKAVNCYIRSVVNGNAPLREQLERRAADGETLAAVTLGEAYSRLRPRDDDKVMSYLRMAAGEGSVDAMRQLALFLLNSRKGAEAFRWFEKGAESGDPTSVYYCGRMLREGGMGVLSDPARGIQYLMRASDLGFGAADYQLGQAYALGLGVRRDSSRACHYYRKAAAVGISNAMFRLATLIARRNTTDFFTALDLFGASAAKGHSRTFRRMFQPSDTTLAGTPFDTFIRAMAAYEAKDFATAGKLAGTLDAKAIPSAATLQGMIYLASENPSRNVGKGVKMLKTASEGGDSRAGLILGTLYESGTGVKADSVKAFRLIRQAAEAGDFRAMSRLGDIYYEGLCGQPRDLTQAVRHYLDAGEWRSQEAAERLAGCYREGTGGLVPDAVAAGKTVTTTPLTDASGLLEIIVSD